MSFDAKIRRWPTPFVPERGEEVRALYPTGAFADLAVGTAGCAPYLHDILLREADWITEAVANPEAALVALTTDADSPQTLRLAKRRAAALIALMDISGVWTLEQTTGALTAFADRAVDVALDLAFAPLHARGKLPEGCRPAVLAMGKMGAHELNYSSDIDLICLFDANGMDQADASERRSQLVRGVRNAMKILSDVTGDGYVFRTDLRLRPDGSATPIVLSTQAALSYYESLGRTWERAAFIKARAAAGDIKVGKEFLAELSPFIWRRHLDFAAIEDAHSIRLKIREHKGLFGPITLSGHDMKLGRGGIREIEFYAQTRQLIAGGRDPELRERGTVEALSALAQAGWVQPDDATTLQEIYRRHREVEHRLQMLRDAQTHTLPHSDEGFDRLAAFMATSADDLRRQLKDDLELVHSLTEPFFQRPRPADEPDIAPEFGAEITARWPGYPALRSNRAVQLFDRLQPRILGRLRRAADPEQALRDFDAFLGGLPAGVQVFSLFESNPQLIDLLADIASVAPPLASYLGRNASVIDAVLDGAFFGEWPGADGLFDRLSADLDAEDDYERTLDTARRWMREWHFRIGVHHMQGLIDGAQAGAQYADLAEAVLRGVWPRVCQQFSTRHGSPPGNGAMILGMGSLGAGRLHARSDLDVLFVYDANGVDTSDGPRPLPTRTYYARLTQALITALSAPMAGGRLYEVDMRLRPSGRHGPVATSIESFEVYQQEEAWTWEHLALTRARPIAGAHSIGQRVLDVRQKVLGKPRVRADVAKDVSDMRARLAAAKPGEGGLSVKDGRGRLQDIELFAQSLALLSADQQGQTDTQIQAGVAAGLISAADGTALTEAAALLWRVRSAMELIGAPGQDVSDLGEGALSMLLRDTGVRDRAALLTELTDTSNAADTIIGQYLGDWGEGSDDAAEKGQP